MENLKILASPPTRSSLIRETILVLVALLVFYLILVTFLRSSYVALVLTVLIVAYLQWMALKARGRWVFYDDVSREVVVEWRVPFQRIQRDVYPLNRFNAVISYYPWGRNSRNWVYLLERASGKGLQLESFDLYYKYRSFWDLFPPIVEAVGAGALRKNVRDILHIDDLGFVGMRSHPGSIKL